MDEDEWIKAITRGMVRDLRQSRMMMGLRVLRRTSKRLYRNRVIGALPNLPGGKL